MSLPVRRGLPAARLALACLFSFTVGAPVAATDTAVTGRITISPLQVGLALAPATVVVGQNGRAQATVTNIGPLALKNISITLRAQSQDVTIGGSAATTLQQLRAGQMRTASWQVCAREPGAYVILAQATVDGSTVESPARVLLVVEGRRGRC